MSILMNENAGSNVAPWHFNIGKQHAARNYHLLRNPFSACYTASASY